MQALAATHVFFFLFFLPPFTRSTASSSPVVGQQDQHPALPILYRFGKDSRPPLVSLTMGPVSRLVTWLGTLAGLVFVSILLPRRGRPQKIVYTLLHWTLPRIRGVLGLWRVSPLVRNLGAMMGRTISGGEPWERCARTGERQGYLTLQGKEGM